MLPVLLRDCFKFIEVVDRSWLQAKVESGGKGGSIKNEITLKKQRAVSEPLPDSTMHRKSLMLVHHGAKMRAASHDGAVCRRGHCLCNVKKDGSDRVKLKGILQRVQDQVVCRDA
jgi:hypothetical protein